MKNIIKKAEVPKGIKNFDVSLIRIQNAGLLAQAVNSVLSVYGEKRPTSGATNQFFPEPRSMKKFQGIVYSSAGAQIISNLATLARENFILTLNNMEVASETISEEQKTMLGLGSLVSGRKIPALVNGGWFEHESAHGLEYCFLLITQKPESVFNRYTLMAGEQFELKGLVPPFVAPPPPPRPSGGGAPPPAPPAPQALPVLILDPYTRCTFHYPQIFAKEFYTSVLAYYVTQPLDKYVISKTAIPSTDQQGRPVQVPIKKTGFSDTDSSITSAAIKSNYEQRLPLIQPDFNAIDIRSSSNDDVYEMMSDASELGKTREGVVSRSLPDLQRELKQLQDSYDADMDADNSEAREIERLRSLIQNYGSIGEDELNPVVFSFGQTVRGTSVYENQLKNDVVKASLRTTEERFINKTVNKNDKQKLNFPSFTSKAINALYVDEQGITGDAGVFSIRLNIGGVFTIQRDGSRTSHTSATPEISAAVSFPNGHRVQRATDFYSQVLSYFPDVLGVSPADISISGGGEILEFGEAFSESIEAESISLKYDDDIAELKRKISELIEDSRMYHYSLPSGMPGEYMIGKKDQSGRIVGRTKKHPLKYINQLEEYLYEISEISPKSLRVLEVILSSEDGYLKIKDSDISLIRIVKEDISLIRIVKEEI